MSLCLAQMWRSSLETLASGEKIGMLRLDINSCSPLNGKQHFRPTSQRVNHNKQTEVPLQVVSLLQGMAAVTFPSHTRG